MTVNKARRTYVTDVHRSLAKKIGKDGADTLTHYLEEVIPAQIEDKVQFLATKEDVAKVEVKVAQLETQISQVRGELKEDIANVKAEVSKIEMKFTERLSQAEARMTHEIAGVKQDIANVELKLSGDISNARNELANVSANLTKWMLATIITIALGVLALYLKN